MTDRTYDIISENDDILARDVPEKNLVTFLNALIDNGYKSVTVREYEEEDRLMKEMVQRISRESSEVKSFLGTYRDYRYFETSKQRSRKDG